ncbi:MAG TPA: 2-C-methyl-D-erythritol 4-phosphate cytidylyltransferase [Gammaproteobacteria bacterium]|nr:2-C-methyl-D-erythritol 4-phosphate cytidylyltransferase [Gammaproteobacteria bacterium]
MTATHNPKHSEATPRPLWAVVPAAGSGRRMAADLPKQYLALNGRTVLEHTLDRLADSGVVAGIMVALAPGDSRWSGLTLPGQVPVETTEGGSSRHLSVLNALLALEDRTGPDDWVLVHDAARPCVRPADIARLVRTLWTDETGGLLGVPVADTMKRVEGERVTATVSRACLWHAHTPQMFRRRQLQAAIESAMQAGVEITDEASAMEHCGWRPRMVEGARDNIKVTTPGDLALAALYLRCQEVGE